MTFTTHRSFDLVCTKIIPLCNDSSFSRSTQSLGFVGNCRFYCQAMTFFSDDLSGRSWGDANHPCCGEVQKIANPNWNRHHKDGKGTVDSMKARRDRYREETSEHNVCRRWIAEWSRLWLKHEWAEDVLEQEEGYEMYTELYAIESGPDSSSIVLSSSKGSVAGGVLFSKVAGLWVALMGLPCGVIG